ncbi:MAG: hypothetical protein RL754_571 [Bacteroidota bacterium]|jgi:SM-20-related protein
MEPFYSTEQWSNWLDRLAADHFVVMDGFLPQHILDLIETEFNNTVEQGELRPAKIGDSFEAKRISEIRSDKIYWLDRNRDAHLTPFFDLIGQVNSAVAQGLFLSLEGYEFHLAQYPPGAFYKAHLDQFESRSNRMLSLVIYLNKSWEKGDGGELVIHQPSELTVEPIYNRAILFRSDTVLHEVLPAVKPRRSLTGWLLKRPSGVGMLNL